VETETLFPKSDHPDGYGAYQLTSCWPSNTENAELPFDPNLKGVIFPSGGSNEILQFIDFRSYWLPSPRFLAAKSFTAHLFANNSGFFQFFTLCQTDSVIMASEKGLVMLVIAL
jgi:hypothetical protein